MKNRSLKKLKMKKIVGILDTKEKVAEFRRNLEEATRVAFEEFAKPISINTKIIVFD